MRSIHLTLLALAATLALAGCGSGAAEQTGAPKSAAPAAVVPADAALFVGVVTDTGSDEWKQVQELLGRFPDGDKVLAEISKSLAGEGLDWEDDVKPALGLITAIVLPRGSRDPVVLTKPPLRAKLDALLHRGDTTAEYEELEDGWFAVAEKRATLDAYEHALDGPRLDDDDDFTAAIDGLPENALATAFVRADVLAAGDWTAFGGSAPTLPTSGFDWFGASLAPADDGIAFDGSFRADTSTKTYEPTLLDRVPAGSVLALSFHGDPKAFDALTGAKGFTPYLNAVQGALGITVRDLLKLFEGQGVLYVRPGLPIPEVTLAVETDDEEQATATVDRIAKRFGGEIQATYLDGTEAHTVRAGDVRISWAADDGILLVSSSRNALRDFRSDGDKLVDDDAFERAAAKVGLGDETAGVAYVDMQRLNELIDGIAGLADEDVPPELAANLGAVESLIATAGAADDGGEFHGFLAIPDR